MKIQNFVKKNAPFVCLTAYTAPIAAMADSHCDLLLVGDSVSMVLYGEATTQKATLEMMIRHGQAVVRSRNNTIIIVDMPYGSYENSKEEALANASRIIDETGCDGVKLEGGVDKADTIAFLTDHKIPVMGHIGLCPQTVSTPDGFRVQGKDEKAAEKLIQDAKAVEAAGAFAFVIEAVPPFLATMITNNSTVPTIGIGASEACDGQILVTEDMLGLSLGKPPKFVKQYASLHSEIEDAVESYAKDVRARIFPNQDNLYTAKPQALKKAS